MIKNITFLFCLFFAGSCLSQSYNHTPVDTVNTVYRAKLRALYNERASHTMASYNGFMDKGFRKILIESYTEINAEFIDKVNNGFFIQDAFYDEQLNELFQQIVKANPQFADLASVRVLLSFAESPNAYAMGDGFVVVQLPLLANVNSKQELAFILCHELAHNLLNHPQGSLQEYAKINSSKEIKQKTREIEKRKYNKAQDASGLYKSIVYSNRKWHRGVEYQADSLGFVLYKNAFPGNEHIVIKSFKAMDDMDREKDSLLPADYQRLFSSSNQPFKPEWIAADEISGYRYNKIPKFWQIDSLKTHPDCADRAQRLKTLFNINEAGDAGTAVDALKTRARYDDVMGLYVMKEYGRSLYCTLLLLKDRQEDKYLLKMAHANLVKIQESQKNYTMNKYVDNVNPGYSNSYNTFLSFLRQLRKTEITNIINQYQSKL
jgi:Zn-dependent protease with chaperone function